MEQLQKVQLDGGSDPVDTTGLCLLSLDGGGVRGLSTLYILKNIFGRLNHERSLTGLPPVKPCEVFDLIGGTSTGGLLAIMLGRLEMDIDECISCYNELIKKVFGQKKSRIPFNRRGNIKGRFDSSILKTAIEKVIDKRGLPKQAPLNDENVRGCRVFVCATAKETKNTTRLRSYNLPEELNIPSTICEAALATSAATTFFDAVEIGARTFVDGAFTANNPAGEVEGEALNIWCSGTLELKPLVKCFVSIGTGHPGKKAIDDNIAGFLVRTLKDIVTETESTAESFISRWRQQYEQKKYFRFNVHQGLQGVGLEEYKEQGAIEAATDEYLRQTEQKSQVRDCIHNLKSKQNKTEKDFAASVNKLTPLGRYSQTGNVHWTVSRLTNMLFTGRDDILNKLEATVRDAVKDSSRLDRCSIVISGMGGQGKSEICLQLACRVRQIFWGVFWVDVSNKSSAENNFLNIASKLGIPAQSMEEAQQGLANLKQSWLLVLDNADDLNVDYQPYFPAGPSGVVILTSRNVECHQYANKWAVELEGLPESDAEQLLLRAANVPLDQLHTLQDDARRVAALVRSHPLALIQAGAYISRGHCTLAGYPGVYKHQRKRLLEFRPTQARSRYGDVYATFEASADVLQASQTEVAKDALDLLPVLGTCAASRLPLLLFQAGWEGAQSITSSNISNDADLLDLTSWHVSHLPSLLQVAADTWDPFRLVEAVSLLKAFSLVSTDTYDGFSSVSMHPLTNAWALDRLDTTKQHDAWLATGCLVAVSKDDEILWRKHGRQLQPHLEALTSWDMDDILASEPPAKIASVIVKCGELLDGLRVDAKLSILMSNLTSYLGLNPLIVDARWLSIYDLIARNSVLSGQGKKAVSLLEQVVEIRKQTLAEDHPSRLASQYMLAEAYQANGQVKEAVSLLEQVVRIQKQTLAEDHPDRLASQHSLAGVYQANRQVKEAVSLLEQVVQIRKQILAEDYPSRLASQHQLARVYQTNGQVKEAVSLLEQVVQIKEQILAEDHPHRLASQHNLAGAYQANGQVKEAVSLLEQVVRIQKQTLAEDHPDRLASQHSLAGAYQANGQVKEAVSLLEQVVQIQKQILAEDHPDRLASQHSLAGAYQANRQVKEAVSLLEHVVRIKKQILAEDHPDRLASQHALAKAYQANRQVKEAVSLLEHVVKIRKQIQAEDHPDRLTSEQVLAKIFWDLDRRDDAYRVMKHVVEIRRKVLDESHPDRIRSEAWLKYLEDKMVDFKPA
ncbi:MAG: hypothetical protein Q9201_004645 [Fulgogasparrea decipioides]